MKKIYLEITPFFPSEKSFRGPYVYDQVKAIERNSDMDVKVVKVVSFFNKEPDMYEYQGVKVYVFKVLDIPSSVLPGLFHAINMKRFENFLKETVGISPSQISCVHGHVAYPAGALAVDFGKKHGIKNFVQHHGLDVMQLSNGRLLRGTLRAINERFIEKRFLKTVNSTDLNIGVSQKVLDELEKIPGFQNPAKYVLYNGVDIEKFYKKEVLKEKDAFTIGCIGNFWPIKDQVTLLKALNLLVQKGIKNIKVVFVGSGPTLSTCQEYVSTHDLEEHVSFLKEIDHTQLNEFYNSLDLFVLPSHYEALGCVYTEALQTGVPIVAVKGQGIEELIQEKDKDNMLIDKGDHTGLAEIIEKYIANDAPKPSVNYDLNIDRFVSNFLDKVTAV